MSRFMPLRVCKVYFPRLHKSSSPPMTPWFVPVEVMSPGHPACFTQPTQTPRAFPSSKSTFVGGGQEWHSRPALQCRPLCPQHAPPQQLQRQNQLSIHFTIQFHSLILCYIPVPVSSALGVGETARQVLWHLKQAERLARAAQCRAHFID